MKLEIIRNPESDIHIDEWLDACFQYIDDELFDGNYNEINDLLSELNPEKYSPEQLLGILTITSAWKDNLPNREDFYNKSHKALGKRYDDNNLEQLLRGLE